MNCLQVYRRRRALLLCYKLVIARVAIGMFLVYGWRREVIEKNSNLPCVTSQKRTSSARDHATMPWVRGKSEDFNKSLLKMAPTTLSAVPLSMKVSSGPLVRTSPFRACAWKTTLEDLLQAPTMRNECRLLQLSLPASCMGASGQRIHMT